MIKTVATKWSNIQRVEWAMKDRIVLGGLNVIVGRGGVGKTSVLCYLTAGWTRGTVEGSLFQDPCSVRVVGPEDGYNTKWLPTLKACGANPQRVKLWRAEHLGPILIRESKEELRALIERQNVRVVIFDAILNNLGATTDTHHARQVRFDLEPLQQMATDLGIAIVICIHTNKRGTNFDQIMQGSTAFRDACRSALWITKVPNGTENERVMFTGKANFAQEGNPLEFEMRRTLTSTPEGPMSVWRPYIYEEQSDLEMDDVFFSMNGSHDRKPSSKQVALHEDMVQAMKKGKRKSTDVIKELEAKGHKYRAILRARDAVELRRTRTPTAPPVEYWES